jgi:hypothetical protein
MIPLPVMDYLQLIARHGSINLRQSALSMPLPNIGLRFSVAVRLIAMLTLERLLVS